jgi:predicted aspartyl protease
MRTYKWLAGGLAVALAACAAARVPQAHSEAGLRSGEVRPPGIPFELTGDKPFVQVRINDSGPLWFIFDTGNGGGFCLDRARAEALGLELKEGREQHTGAGEGVVVQMATATGVTVQVGHVKAAEQTLIVVPLDHVAVYEGRAVDGLIGRSFMSQFVVELDYAGKRIYLRDPRSFKYSGPGRALPIRLVDGLTTVRGAIKPPGSDSIAGDFVIDTGARTALLLTRPFAEEHQLLERIPKTCRGTIGGGAGGECKGFVGRLESMQLGPFRVSAPVVSCSLDNGGVLTSTAFAGIVGGPLLRRCRVFFDYPHERMILEPYSRTPAPYEYDASGLFVVAMGPDFGNFAVVSVAEQSPAAEAGMRRGDVILGVDGRPASGMTLEELRQLLKQPDQSRRLELQRGTEHLDVTLRLRRLI